MSAPISIPIHIEDDGTATLIKMAGGFDNLALSGDKLSKQFALTERASLSFRGELDAGTKALQAMTGESDLLTKALGKTADAFKLGADGAKTFTDAQDALTTGARQSAIGIDSARLSMAAYGRTLTGVQGQIDATIASMAGMRTVGGVPGFANTIGGGASRTVAADSSAFLRAGSTSIGPASFGGSALGIPVPVLAAAVVGYLGYKAVSTANAYNQGIVDIVSQSTQDAASIPGLQSGVLNLTGGQNRFTAQQLTQGLYPIASSPIFAKQADQLSALGVVSQQAQGSGAGSIKSLASADVGAISAYGFSPSQMQFVADTIQKGVNIGLAESPDFAKGVGTFSAASLAADPNKSRAFQQAVGAFAQQTNLSPRFRFDAQGENAFLQSINKPLTGKGGQLADALGISNLFGPGAEGQAGGLQAWLQQFQTATGGANQQAYMQTLFGRQNALQFARGFTGSNYASGQIAISGTADAANTVARGAKIADAGPQAQWDQIGSEFNKKVIELGDTISKTLNPALGTLATAVLNTAGPLGDGLGALGNKVDWLVNLIPGAHGVMPSSQGPQNDLNLRGTSFPVTGPYNDPKNKLYNPYADPNSGYYDPSILTPTQRETYAQVASQAQARQITQARHVVPAGFMGPLAPGETRAVDFSSMHPAGLGTDPAADAAMVGMRQAAANALLTAQSGSNAKQLLADRGALNYQLALNNGQGGSAANLGTALAKLHTDLAASGMTGAAQQQYLQKFGTNPVDKLTNQRLVDAAQMQYNASTTFEQSVRIHQGGLAASNQAAQQVYAASMNLIAVEAKAGTLKKTDAAILGLGAQDTLNQQLLANLSPAMQEAQSGLSLALAKHGNVAGARAGVADLYRQQEALGAFGPQTLALDLYNLSQQGKIATPGAQLIRSPESGLGDALLGAGSGAGTIAQLSRSARASDPLAETVRHLQLIIARDEKIIQELQRGNENTSAMREEIQAGAIVSSPPAHNAGTPVRRGFGVR
jgi:TP901 family phage tail tape measure protein